MSEDGLIEFPCAFPIKVMGLRSDDFTRTVVAIVSRHAPGFSAAGVEMRASQGGKYLSLTCIIRAESRTQLDALYLELTGHPDVKLVL